MKYAHYDKNTGKLLCWYSKDINSVIPEPYLKVSEKDWKKAIENNYNYIDIKKKTLSKKDFRSLEQIKQEKKQKIEMIYSSKSQEPIEYQLDSTNNYTFQADSKSQDILTKVITFAPLGFEVDWLDVDNNKVHLKLNELKELANLILTRNQELFVKKVILKKQVDSVSSADELKNIKLED